MNTKALVNKLMQSNPDIKNDPNRMRMLRAVLTNDEKTGIEIANNLLNTYGVSKEEGIKQATDYFDGML